MMLYAIIASDKNNSLEGRKKARPNHLLRLEELKKQNRLVIAGPHPIVDDNEVLTGQFSGSLIVAEFDNLKSAKTWANDDPYFAAGVYEQVIVKPYNKIF